MGGIDPRFTTFLLDPGWSGMTTWRLWPSEEKLRIILEGLKLHAHVEEICRQHGISS